MTGNEKGVKIRDFSQIICVCGNRKAVLHHHLGGRNGNN
mgnify:FL=1